MSEREFLFEYRFDGDIYGLLVVAKDIETARRKVSAMTFALYRGEVALKIPVPGKGSRAGWFKTLFQRRSADQADRSARS